MNADSEEENVVVKAINEHEMDKLVKLCDMIHDPNIMDASSDRNKRWFTVEGIGFINALFLPFVSHDNSQTMS